MVSTPQEILFAIGVILFAATLALTGVIIRFLLRFIQSKSIIWILPFVSTILVILFAVLHFHTTITFLPKLIPSETELIRLYYRLQFYGSLMFFISSLFAFIASGFYFWRATR